MFQQRIGIGLPLSDGAARSPDPLPRSCPILLAAIVAEVAAASTPDESEAFFMAVGARIAGLVDLAGVETADDLAARVNAFWGAFGWGEARLDLDERGVAVRHYGFPATLDSGEDDPEGRWLRAGAPVLAGAYARWFHALGSDPALPTRVVAVTAELIELRHGY